MITHPGARTRALYKWEKDEIDNRPGNRTLSSAGMGTAIACEVWDMWNCSRPIPRVLLRDSKGHPYCQGYSLIVLTYEDCLVSTLLHELVHARGFGVPGNFHTVGFVQAYINVLGNYLGWDNLELELQAHDRGLI